MKKLLFLLAAICAVPAIPAHADEPFIPGFQDARERLTKPDLAALPRLRFLTANDFPPFNYLDADGKLSGFHIDLVRHICTELKIMAKCQVQALPWAELDEALAAKQGEVIIAGIAVTAQNRERYAFSQAYFSFPARFVTLKTATLSEPLFQSIKGKRIGVISGSAHEKMLREMFGTATPVGFDSQESMYAELKEGRIAGIFGDGMRLSFWLAGDDSAGCCGFAGGPYFSVEHLGNGLAIATSRQTPELAEAMDYALRQITAKGAFAELYLRYFPIGFY